MKRYRYRICKHTREGHREYYTVQYKRWFGWQTLESCGMHWDPDGSAVGASLWSESPLPIKFPSAEKAEEFVQTPTPSAETIICVKEGVENGS